MNDQVCENCKYYLQHYTLIDGNLRRVFCGHCTKNTRKRKRPDDRICELFVPGTSIKEEMVSREFLTKALLQRVLNMELFPDRVD